MSEMTLERAGKLTQLAYESGNADLTIALLAAKARGDEEFAAFAAKVEDRIGNDAAKADEALWPLWYADDLAEPEEDVFV